MAAIEESSERIGGGGPITMGEMIDLADRSQSIRKTSPKQTRRTLRRCEQSFLENLGTARGDRESAEIVHEAMRNVRDTNSDQAVIDSPALSRATT